MILRDVSLKGSLQIVRIARIILSFFKSIVIQLFRTIMSKSLKSLVFVAYAFVLIQFLKYLLRSNDATVELDYVTYFTYKGQNEMIKKLTKYKKNITAMQQGYKRPERFATDLKYILKYTNSLLHYGTSLYKNGQVAFIYNKCKYRNCYLTSDVSMLVDIRNFDAILFDVENSWDSIVLLRDRRQKYIFVASESAANYPLCDKSYNNYFNLTWTYKLNSDMRLSYVSIEDKKGNVVGPNINMSWIHPMKPTPDAVKSKLTRKKKAAAWFVSNCRTLSHRENKTKSIQKALFRYNLTIDVYGYCGIKTCPKGQFDECLMLLETNYYFYLSFENSFSEDYVTEKILYPLQHYTVPIVYGGANYSRFLPPGSYINARELNATEIADLMYEAINNHTIYQDYFRWHNHYTYFSLNTAPDVCRLCEILNTEANKHSTYENFLKWWKPDYNDGCHMGDGRVLIENKMESLVKDPHILNRDPDVFMDFQY